MRSSTSNIDIVSGSTSEVSIVKFMPSGDTKPDALPMSTVMLSIQKDS